MSSATSRFNIPDKYFVEAIQFFWEQRDRQAGSARAGEGQGRSVRGGKHLDGFLVAIVKLMAQHDVPKADIFTNCSLHDTGKLELPGYFRATKEWDLLVVREGQLLAALELKAQVGPSFGNNTNNRTEEALGSAEDVWTAYREGAFAKSAQPWLGYFFLLEDHPKSTRPVRNNEPHFKVFKEFDGASYARRYELLCQKLVLERKYTSACFLMSQRPRSDSESIDDTGSNGGADQGQLLPPKEEAHDWQTYTEPNEDIGARQFLSSLLRSVVSD